MTRDQDRVRKQTVGKRAEQARDHHGVSASEMGRLLGQKHPNMYFRKERGERPLHDNELRKLAAITGVRFEWLKTGEGAMFSALKPQVPLKPAPDDSLSEYLPPAVEALWNSGRCSPLTRPERDYLRQRIDAGDSDDIDTLELLVWWYRAFKARGNPEAEERAQRDLNAAFTRLRKNSGVRSASSHPPPPDDEDDVGILRAPRPARLPKGLERRND
jgi:transcriptional regulator with XRE-family HTH domain